VLEAARAAEVRDEVEVSVEIEVTAKELPGGAVDARKSTVPAVPPSA
jgi:hypothetical protein